MTAVLERVSPTPRSPFTRPAARGVAAPPPAAPAGPRLNPVVRWTFAAYLFSIPFEIPHRGGIPLEIPTLFGFIFLFATLLERRVCYARPSVPLRWFALYMWVFVVASLVHAGDQQLEVLKLLVEMFQLLFLFWAGAGLTRDLERRRWALGVFGAACLARAALQVLGMGATARHVWTGGDRVTAFGQNANLSAIILSTGLIAIVGLRFAPKRPAWRPAVSALPAALVIAVAVLQTGSRGGLIGLLLGLFAFLWHGTGLWGRVRNAIVAAVFVGGLAWSAGQSVLLRNRFHAAEIGQLAGRERIYPILLGMFREQPFIGWGPIHNQFELARRLGDPTRERRDAHNIVLELLTTTGVIGAIPFLIGLGLCVGAGWRSRAGPDGMLIVAMLCSVLFGTMSGTWIASKILWLTLAVAVAAGRRD